MKATMVKVVLGSGKQCRFKLKTKKDHCFDSKYIFGIINSVIKAMIFFCLQFNQIINLHL